MSQQNQSSGNQQNGPASPNPPATNTNIIPWFQLLVAIISNIAYIKINAPDLFSLLLFNVVALGGISLYKIHPDTINNINGWIDNAFGKVFGPVKRRFSKMFSGTQTTSQLRARKHFTHVVLYLAYILIIIIFLFQNFFIAKLSAAADYACVKGGVQLFCAPGIGVSSLMAPDHTMVRVGLISNTNEMELPFDWTGSSGADQEIEVEKKILQEQNIQNHACSGKHITLAVVTILSRTVSDSALSADVGLEDLRGAYLAQQDYNSRPNVDNARLCLVIANIGTQATAQEALPGVVRQLILYAKSDPSFLGIVGVPFSAQADQALQALNNWGQGAIPIISPSVTSDDFSHKPNFYRIAAPDEVQSDMMAKFIKRYFVSGPCPQVKPTIAVFYDINKGTNQPDQYSNSLASAFINALQNNGVCAKPVSVPYIIGDNTVIEANVQDAIVNKAATMIFFAGYANDIDAVEYGVQLAQQQQSPAAKVSIPIFAGDAVYDLTRYVDNTYSIVYSTIYAPPLNRQSDFVRAYYQAFPQPLPTSKVVTLNAYTLLPPHAILSYDATKAFLQAFENTRDKTDQQDFDKHLATVEFTGVNDEDIVLQGNNSSNPGHKSVYILCTDHAHAIQVAAASDGSYPSLGDVQRCTK
ncbi:hypothetical protein EPA93_24550 [Ktedonosporobacter rubrisoli]|uniref:Receptor ligand binding region domain-containing protein n=1 Tax=Ktedonosporobacter rubrisoli TaxID=2509675 RepID=A0A4V0YZ99_KTERU|nr:ABC transporter substrate-binding protein [Ktedonosporobacter rubrisoli]QBD78981.1 hypothetical protein EPA93_24550 [Ktedonosporobacter rubrisoli]